MHILVTGGEGFIGSNLIRRLSKTNELARIISIDRDKNISTRSESAKYVNCDLNDNLDHLFIEDYDVIFHLASEVGSGLSIADPYKFINSNCSGMSNLLEAMRNCKKLPKIILASSATVYGEATYKCKIHGIKFPFFREDAQLKSERWEVECPECDFPMSPVGIHEDRPLQPASIYGETKLSQERICSLLGRSWGFDTVALRLFGVFGPGQSLGNPYTGVLAFFSTLALAGVDIEHYEDGGQLKGYTFIEDVVDAFIQASLIDIKGFNAVNIGLPEPQSIISICELITKYLKSPIKFFSKKKYRVSDTRHSWPDITKAQSLLNWNPMTNFEIGLEQLLLWMKELSNQEISSSLKRFEKAQAYALKMGLPL